MSVTDAWLSLRPRPWIMPAWGCSALLAVWLFQHASTLWIASTVLNALLTVYALRQRQKWHMLPHTLRPFIKSLSKPQGKPVLVIFNLTNDPLKINAVFDHMLSEKDHHLHLYLGKSAPHDVLMFDAQALLPLSMQRKLLHLLVRHIPKHRMLGLGLQLSASRLLHTPPFKTLRSLIQEIGKNDSSALHYQLLIYDDSHPRSQDAVVLRPQNGYTTYPKVWEALKQSFQNLIQKTAHKGSEGIQASPLELMMPPLQHLLYTLSHQTALQCDAIHLIGFHLPKEASSPILLKRSRPWPLMLSRLSMLLFLASMGFVIWESRELAEKIERQKAQLASMDQSLLIQEVVYDFIKQHPVWASWVLPAPHQLPSLPEHGYELFAQLPEERQLQGLQSLLAPHPPFMKAEELIKHQNQIATLFCALQHNHQTACIERTEQKLLEEWVARQLQSLEKSLIPINMHQEEALLHQHIAYLLNHPEMIGEQLGPTLDLLNQLAMDRPMLERRAAIENLTQLAKHFNKSASYQALKQIIDPELKASALRPLNPLDQQIMQGLHAAETTLPPQMQALAQSWEGIYQAANAFSHCYPFEESAQDCDPAALVAFFKPGEGLFDRWWKQYLEPVWNIHPEEKTPWLNPSWPDDYMQLRLIQRIFFPNGEPEFILDVKPQLAPKTTLSLHMPKETPLYTGSQSTLRWHYLHDQDFHLEFDDSYRKQRKTYPGPWGFLRFLDHALKIEGSQVFLEGQPDGQSWRLELLSPMQTAPWRMDLIRHFHLPKHLLHQDSPIEHETSDIEQEKIIDDA